MTDIEHGSITPADSPTGTRGIHPIRAFPDAANAAARTGITQVAGDLGRVIYQTDTQEYYIADGAGGWRQMLLMSPSAYSGYGVGDCAWASATWTGAMTIPDGGWTDVIQNRITRSTNDLTFEDAGTYLAYIRAAMRVSTGGMFGLRLRDISGLVTKVQHVSFAPGATVIEVVGTFTVTAGQALRVQYAEAITSSNITGGTLDGEVHRVMSVDVHRLY